VLSGISTVKTIVGFKEVLPKDLTVEEVAKVPEIEAFLEKLTGYRVHIEQVN
jgi:hypothetical protein